MLSLNMVKKHNFGETDASQSHKDKQKRKIESIVCLSIILKALGTPYHYIKYCILCMKIISKPQTYVYVHVLFSTTWRALLCTSRKGKAIHSTPRPSLRENYDLFCVCFLFPSISKYIFYKQKKSKLLLLKIQNYSTPNILFNNIYINFDILYTCSKNQHKNHTNKVSLFSSPPSWLPRTQVINKS